VKTDTEQYFHEVSALLPCSRKEKRRCLQDLRAGVLDYLQERPGAGREELYRQFGSPQDIADAWLADGAGAGTHRRREKRAVLLALAALVVLAAIIAAVTILNYRADAEFREGKIVEIIAEGENVDQVLEQLEADAIVSDE
jgi:hypothetical protein